MHVDFNKESLHKELETEIWLWLIRNSENIITGIIIIILLLLLSLLRHCPGPAGGGGGWQSHTPAELNDLRPLNGSLP